MLNPGDSKEFTTSIAFKGQAHVIVYWNDSIGAETKIQATASVTSCTITSSLSIESNRVQNPTLNESPGVYPNPVENRGFYISFSERYGDQLFNANIYDLNGINRTKFI